MKFKTLIIFLIFNVNSLSAQFFDCEEDFEIIENEEIIDAAANILSEKASIFLIDSIVDYGKIFLGTPYRYGGSTPSAFDCSGFVSYVYNNFGIKLPRTATAQYLANTHIDRENLHKGDLVFFEGRKKNSRIGHVGIVVSDSLENGLFKFMHASVTRGVTVSLSNENYYENRYITACRIVEIDSISIPRKRTDILVKKDIENQYHTVKKGETLYFISKKYGKTVAQLKTLNKISDNNLKIGQKLLINKMLNNKSEKTENKNNQSENQMQLVENKQTSEEKSNGYTVKAGDTLYKISKRFNTTVEKIKQDNNLTTNDLKINQHLIVFSHY